MPNRDGVILRSSSPLRACLVVPAPGPTHTVVVGPDRVDRGPAGRMVVHSLFVAASEGRYLDGSTLMARAATRMTVTTEMSDWASMSIFAHRVSGIVSVGENAVALVKDT